MNSREYAGFWIRAGASIIDTILILAIIWPILAAIYGADYWSGDSFVYGVWDVLFSYILPAVALICTKIGTIVHLCADGGRHGRQSQGLRRPYRSAFA